jgi:hypothetical protein
MQRGRGEKEKRRGREVPSFPFLLCAFSIPGSEETF